MVKEQTKNLMECYEAPSVKVHAIVTKPVMNVSTMSMTEEADSWD